MKSKIFNTKIRTPPRTVIRFQGRQPTATGEKVTGKSAVSFVKSAASSSSSSSPPLSVVIHFFFLAARQTPGRGCHLLFADDVYASPKLKYYLHEPARADRANKRASIPLKRPYASLDSLVPSFSGKLQIWSRRGLRSRDP